MSLSELLKIDEQQKALLWEIFECEKVLDDTEAMLMKDLQNYENRIRNLGKVETSIEIGLMATYIKHVKNIRALLISIKSTRYNNEKNPAL